MATSETAIANSALVKVGGNRIVALTDNTREALLLREQYTKVLEDLLRSHPWNFAIVRANLVALTTVPAWGFSKEFQVPADCLRILEIDAQDFEWMREGDTVRTDSTSVGALYISNAIQPGQFDACFSEAFATKLAADVCYAISQSVSLTEALEKKFRDRLREARSFDAQEGGTRQVYAREWLNSRS